MYKTFLNYHLIYLQKIVLCEHFCICKNNFYWLFTRFLFIYNFHQFYSRNSLWQSLATFSTQGVNQHIKHTNTTCQLVQVQQKLPGESLGLSESHSAAGESFVSDQFVGSSVQTKRGAPRSSRQLIVTCTGCTQRHNPDNLLRYSCSLNSRFVARLSSKRRMTSSV